MTPLPTTVVSGYLGAGKTTLVNRLLAAPHGLAITVLVNDFGAVALDDALIESADDDVIALANGCMCCQIGGALYDTIDRVIRLRQEGKRIDHMVIETSGVADPARIMDVARAEPDLEARHTLVLVDALNWPALHGDPALADTLERQLGAASIVHLAKTDLVPADALPLVRVEVEQLAPGVPVLSETDSAALLARHDAGPPSAVLARHEPEGTFASWSWDGADEVDAARAEIFVAREDLGLWRVKGILRTPSGGLAIQRAGTQIVAERREARPARSRIVAVGTSGRFDPARVDGAWRAEVMREGKRDAP